MVLLAVCNPDRWNSGISIDLVFDCAWMAFETNRWRWAPFLIRTEWDLDAKQQVPIDV